MCCERQFPAKILFLLATQSLASSRTAIVVDTYGDLETLVSELVDVKRIAELDGEIRAVDGHLRIGARTTMTTIADDPRVRRDYAALAEAASVVGSVQIRNRATLAGNLCNASPAADTAPALLVYGAAVIVVWVGKAMSIFSSFSRFRMPMPIAVRPS